jgi:hypothetical protein
MSGIQHKFTPIYILAHTFTRLLRMAYAHHTTLKGLLVHAYAIFCRHVPLRVSPMVLMYWSRCTARMAWTWRSSHRYVCVCDCVLFICACVCFLERGAGGRVWHRLALMGLLTLAGLRCWFRFFCLIPNPTPCSLWNPKEKPAPGLIGRPQKPSWGGDLRIGWFFSGLVFWGFPIGQQILLGKITLAKRIVLAYKR